MGGMRHAGVIVAIFAVMGCSQGGNASDGGAIDAGVSDAGALDAGTTTDGGGLAAAAGVYITNSGDSSIRVFAKNATGNVAPLRVLAGANTGLSLPIGMAFDPQGNLYVANRTGAGVTVYAPNATGNASPLRTLSDPQLGAAQTLAIGPTGEVWVAACPNCGQSGGGVTGLFHFPAGATASDRSIAGATTLLQNPAGVALDASGNVIVADAFGGVVSAFAADASGDVAPIRSFAPGAGQNVQALAVADGTIFITEPGVGVVLYPATADGDAGPAATLAFSGDLSVSYPGGVSIDDTISPPVVYVVDYGAGAIDVVQTSGTPPNLSIGSVSTIAGTNTGLSQPLDVLAVP